MRNLPTRPDRHSWRIALLTALVALSPAFAAPASADMDEPRWITRQTPAYPFGALTRGIEGSVLLEYTVDARGRVIAPRVLEASPPGVFDRAALHALSRWRYQPNGGTSKLMKVRLTFRR
ncbi:MAG: energy transducer TonB [Myxococcota bacterium]